MTNGRNGYVCHWNGRRVEIYADTLLAAKNAAVAHFQATTRKRVRPYDVTATLAEKNGQPVTHNPAIL